MMVLMKQEATPEEIQEVHKMIRSLGYKGHEIHGSLRTAIAVTGNQEKIDPDHFSTLPGVDQAIPVSKPYKLVGRDAKHENSQINVSGELVGGKQLAIMAGPCSVESREQLMATARAVKAAGATFLRGGAFKPRTSPYAFQGMKEEGLVLLREAREETGLKIVTEVKDVLTLSAVADVADLLQIGARNMSNFSLLEAVGDLRKPVLLKRGISSTIEEMLMAAEYICARGNMNVILCERGIRTFENATRNTLDLNAVPMVKKLSHLPIMVDPSHGIGISDVVPAMAMAGIAAGADGLIVEVHPHPEAALSDGAQSLKPDAFVAMMRAVRRIAEAVDRTVPAEVAA